MDKLPIYRFVVSEDDEAEVTAVALVDDPAIELNWIAFSSEKISFDFDDTLTTQRGYDMAKKLVESGANVYIISARKDASEILKVADELRIPKSNVFATGSNNAKVEKIKELGIKTHYDNNANVIKKLEGVGVKFVVEPKDNESESEFMSRCISIEMDNGYEQDQAIAMCSTKWGGFKKYSFKADKEKRIISGALMVADLPIYRRDANGFEYYGLFTSEDIYNIRNKFFKKGYINEVNKMHDPNQFVDGVYMIESFIIDSKRGINAPDGLQLPDGSWFGSYKVDNEEVWNNFIKTGEFKGFSVEGDFRLEKLGDKPLTTIEQMIDIIKQIDDHTAKQNALNELNSMVKSNINIS